MKANKSLRIPDQVKNGELSLDEYIEMVVTLKDSSTTRTLVMVCISSVVGLILTLTIAGLFLAQDKDMVINLGFMAATAFASEIAVIVVMAFMGMRATIPKSKTDEANEKQS